VQGEAYLTNALVEFRKLRQLGEHALAQTSDETFFAARGADANSIALIVKHLAGNMRSRWTDFLTTDGEKPDRHRDREFELGAGDTREALVQSWEEGWTLLFETIGSLTPADLEATVTIRGEPHTVLQAMSRQMTHYAYHVGQIVLLAKQAAGAGWRSASIPRGKSAEFNARMREKHDF